MPRPPRWQNTLEASIQEACLAVRLYNDSSEARSFESFVIHMHLAWLYLIHAEFIRDDVDFRYWDPRRKNRLQKVDGEPKRWELQRSIEERWKSNNDPIRANIELFIRLRNRLEHRHTQADKALMLYLSGHAHAYLVNYEKELTSQFGNNHSLAAHLHLPLFVGSLTEEGEQALRRYKKTLPGELQKFVTDYESGLDESVLTDPRYELRLRATLELAPKDPDAIALQFTQYDDLSSDEKEAIEQLGKRGMVITKEKRQNVSGLGKYMASQAAREVREAISFEFNQHHFTKAWKLNKWRPSQGDPHPQRTNSDFCEYDEPTKTYRYTKACIHYLIRKCQTEKGFTEVTGKKPVLKQETIPPQNER